MERREELAGPASVATVGTSEIFITTRAAESAQGNLATDALLYTDIDFAFQNSGGLRADLTKEANLDAGTGLCGILRADVLEIWPFGNFVALAEITGEQLEEYLNHGVSQIGGGLFIQSEVYASTTASLTPVRRCSPAARSSTSSTGLTRS
ncbi:MAG: hypothetical protein EA388_11715 [Nitriliruptor sp.]|nr:MAG: hypothetical protein EA388_11715 [Nitriliruptor sp.]